VSFSQLLRWYIKILARCESFFTNPFYFYPKVSSQGVTVAIDTELNKQATFKKCVKSEESTVEYERFYGRKIHPKLLIQNGFERTNERMY
jgi:hypothetical protein